MNAIAEVKTVIEVRCPSCQSWNRYHDLDAVHANVKRHIEKLISSADKPTTEIGGKCRSCSKTFTIKQLKF